MLHFKAADVSSETHHETEGLPLSDFRRTVLLQHSTQSFHEVRHLEVLRKLIFRL